MPLKLIEPRIGYSKNWRIRGAYLGHRIDQTAGTPDKKIAAKILARIRDEIECGAFSQPGAPTFASAANKYLDAGGELRFVLKLADHFGETPLARINQAAVDAASLALYPRATPATRNRQVYSPVSAILKAAGVADGLKRPKGARGARRLYWLTPEQASALLATAEARDAEFGLFLAFLLYTGCRLTEALSLQVASVNLSEGWARVLETKNGEPRLVHLPPVMVAALATHPRGLERIGKVFRFGKNGRLYVWLDEAARVAGVEIPRGVAFHAFRHTWGAWMRRYGGLDTTGLVETGAWRSRQAAAVYEHAEQSAEARKADLLPNVWGKLPCRPSREGIRQGDVT
jgi:integrase